MKQLRAGHLNVFVTPRARAPWWARWFVTWRGGWTGGGWSVGFSPARWSPFSVRHGSTRERVLLRTRGWRLTVWSRPADDALVGVRS